MGVARGQQFVEALDEISNTLPEEILTEENLHQYALTDQTAPTVHLLSEAPAPIRSHHNLFGQFQYKCIGLADLVNRVIDRAEQVTGPDLLDQYRQDQQAVGFKQSAKPIKPRGLGPRAPRP